MQREDQFRLTSIFSVEVLASLAITAGVLFDYAARVSGHFAYVHEVGIVSYAYFMITMAFLAMLVLFMYSMGPRRRLFILLAMTYVLVAFALTAFSGLHTAERLPFRFVQLFYWVAVMLLAYYSVLSLNTVKVHVAMVVLALPVLAYRFYVMRHAEAALRDVILLNPAFLILFLMPVILMLKSKALKTGCILIIFAVIVLSYKRMAILAFLTSMPVYFYCLSRTSPKSGLWKKVSLVMGAGAILAVLVVFYRHLVGVFGLDWGARMGDLVRGGGGGRIGIWQSIIVALMANPSQWLFGRGYGSVMADLNMWAHNDILEIGYEFGLVGLAVYFLFAVVLLHTFHRMLKFRYRHAGAFAVSLVLSFWGGMTDVYINHTGWFLSIALFWGLAIADFDNTMNQAALAEIEDSSFADQYDGGDAADTSYS